MNKPAVAVVRYERPLESVRKAVELSDGLSGLPSGAKVFVKPNIVFWTRAVPFPKWGVITTSRVVEDMVTILKGHGIDNIAIGEGMVLYNPKDAQTPAHAFESLGYGLLKKRYGVHIINVHERPFRTVDVGDGIKLNFNIDFLQSDYLVNIPVLKTHAQTVVSLGIKNLKGLIDVKSRKKCHSADPEKDLNFMISRLAMNLPPSCTIVDGIYTNERGPALDGKIRRSDLLIASPDPLSADKVGARILGYDPSAVPHLVHAAAAAGRTTELSDLQVVGENIEDVELNLKYSFEYNETGTLPIRMEKMGIKGLSYPKYDLTMCTYCSALTGIILMSIAYAWKGEPWDDVEVLTGKVMKPTPARNKTILIGKCLYEANKKHPNIRNVIAVKTCPPSPQAVANALHQAGIQVNPQIFDRLDLVPGFYMRKYEGKPEFDESLYRIQ
jgi:uncharacterized protein (DUF362 family)